MEIRVAAGRRERMRGLRNRSRLGPGEGLLFPRCRSVHTFGMRFPIGVIYLDARYRVIDVAWMQPNRLARPRFRAKHVLECMPNGRVYKGMRLDEIR
jgi:uncharacterized membrane protein (UPF0127 family)